MNYKKFIQDVKHAVLSVADSTEVIIAFKNDSGLVVSFVECFDPRSRLPIAIIKFRDRVRLVNVNICNSQSINLANDEKRSDMLCAIKALLQSHDERATIYCLSAKGITVKDSPGGVRCVICNKTIAAFTTKNPNDFEGVVEGAVVIHGYSVNFIVSSDLGLDTDALHALGNRLMPLVRHLDHGYTPPQPVVRPPLYAQLSQ